jgi:hypothetical protein
MPLRQSATWTDLQFSVMTPKQCHAKENAESNAYAWDPYPMNFFVKVALAHLAN